MQTATPKTIIMSANGTATQTSRSFDWPALLMALSISAASGSFVFAWKTNAVMAVMQEQRIQDRQAIMDLKQDINNLNLEVRNLREDIIREKVRTN